VLSQLLTDIQHKAEKAQFKIILFDYDGTLSPIVSNPEKAFLDEEIRTNLIKINNKEGVSVGIVTGRSLQAIQNFVQIDNLLYITNHGNLIVENNKIIDTTTPLKDNSTININYQALLNEIQNIDPNIYIEEKEVSTAFHYRNVETTPHDILKDTIIAKIKAQADSSQMVLKEGKKVIEIFSASVNKNKGTAILKTIENFQKNNPEIKDLLVSFIGDDITDEDGFAVLNKLNQVTVKVGPGETIARYRLSKTDEVKTFIQSISQTL